MIITITDDFDLKKIADSGQTFRCRIFDDGTYRFITREYILYIKKIENTQYEISCSLEEWEKVWMSYFDFDRDYAKIRRDFQDDLFLTMAADVGEGIRILRQDAWEMLISFIISQRKSIPAIKSCIEKICTLCGNKIQTEREEVFAFPIPAALYKADTDKLAACGLGYRLPYIQNAATRIYEEPTFLQDAEELDDSNLLERLKLIKGVGDKVANCIMLFAYKRTSSAPVDTWINKVIQQKYDGINPFPNWGDVAGIAQQYIFYYSLTHKDEF